MRACGVTERDRKIYKERKRESEATKIFQIKMLGWKWSISIIREFIQPSSPRERKRDKNLIST